MQCIEDTYSLAAKRNVLYATRKFESRIDGLKCTLGTQLGTVRSCEGVVHQPLKLVVTTSPCACGQKLQ
jgi:hypothetical protein